LLTVRDVARRLQIHEVTVRRHILSGRLKAVRVGKSVRVTPEDLQEYLHPRDAKTGIKASSRSQGIAEPETYYRTPHKATPSPLSALDSARDDAAALPEFEWPEPNWALLEKNLAFIEAARAALPKKRARRKPRPFTMDDPIVRSMGSADVPEAGGPAREQARSVRGCFRFERVTNRRTARGELFVDSSAFLAIRNRRDSYYEAARHAVSVLANVSLVTTTSS
jgi:excisionase family DNA binding protein